jgi:hypothetical protein
LGGRIDLLEYFYITERKDEWRRVRKGEWVFFGFGKNKLSFIFSRSCKKKCNCINT